jgi:hypothetical protein
MIITTQPFRDRCAEKNNRPPDLFFSCGLFIHRSKNEKPRESLAACPWFDVVLSVANSLIRQTSTQGRQRKIIPAPKAERVKVVKGICRGHEK